MTPYKAMLRLERIRKALPKQCNAAVKQSTSDGIKLAQKWSLGPYTSYMLMLMGHPYSTRFGAPAPPQPVGRINIQTGLFANSWVATPITITGNAGLKATVYNTAPYAIDLQRGTSRTIPRPTVGLVKTDLKPIYRANVRMALRSAINTP